MKKVCEVCGGSGQISYFKGVSRFLLSTEECPQCLGLGSVNPGDEGTASKKIKTEKGDKPRKSRKR
ncbi:MAG: hypothetical protein KKE17_09865 [Proteobacteria bacterium]|nr:hypothetical protein [Pseudomonadota bacterium]MBU1710298.1 hypothetical protein [Pseudomonadota bacterium]